jgi:hypothetical protein
LALTPKKEKKNSFFFGTHAKKKKRKIVSSLALTRASLPTAAQQWPAVITGRDESREEIHSLGGIRRMERLKAYSARRIRVYCKAYQLFRRKQNLRRCGRTRRNLLSGMTPATEIALPQNATNHITVSLVFVAHQRGQVERHGKQAEL